MKRKTLKILITGGAGYIGSHLINQLLLNNDYKIFSIDKDYSPNQKYNKGCVYIRNRIGNKNFIKKILRKEKIDLIIHLASLIRVDESAKKPLKYFKNNILEGISLLEAMRETNTNKIIYSSSAAVYGYNQKKLIKENDPACPSSIYGLTKLEFEKILKFYHNNYNFKVIIFRIFNAAGADPSGKLKEIHKPETHLIPKIIDSLKSKKPILIYGKNYNTDDGTCLRDYIHVNDIASAFVSALSLLNKNNSKIMKIYNLGSAKAYSVKEVIDLSSKILNKKIKVVYKDKRIGDSPVLTADNKRIESSLKWKPKYKLEDIIIHTFNSR